MAFSEFFCQSGGANNNSGSTNTDAATLTYASGSWVQSTGVFTVASGDPVADGVAVGDFASVYVDGASHTGFVGRVTARTTTTITVSLTVKSGSAPADGTSNRTLKIGGAWKGMRSDNGPGFDHFPLGILDAKMVNTSNHRLRLNLKNDATYTADGAISVVANSDDDYGMTISGYSSTPGDGGRAIIDGGTSGASYVLFTAGSTVYGLIVENIEFRNNGATGSANGVDFNSTRGMIRRCVVHDVRGNGFLVSSGQVSVIEECEAYACNQSNTSQAGGMRLLGGAMGRRLTAHHNTGSNNNGFVLGGTNHNCDLAEGIAHANGANGAYLGGTNGSFGIRITIHQCDFYDNAADGVKLDYDTAGAACYISNSNFLANGGAGVDGTSMRHTVVLTNCGFGAGTMANTSGPTAGMVDLTEIGTVTYDDDVTPWVDPDDGDFRINLEAAKGTGRGSFLQTQSGYGDPNATVAFPDIGAAQHEETGGSGTAVYEGLHAIEVGV